jgi:hypothetical protein
MVDYRIMKETGEGKATLSCSADLTHIVPHLSTPVLFITSYTRMEFSFRFEPGTRHRETQTVQGATNFY